MPCKLAITSMSLGRAEAGHDLERRLDVAHLYGYQGIELFYDDLVDVARRSEKSSRPSPVAQLQAAQLIYRMCKKRSIEVVCLQPFWHYEGLVDREEHKRHIKKMTLWIELAHELHTDMIQVPSNFLPKDRVSQDTDLMVKDLREIAEMGSRARPPIRFAYEALAWGTHIDTWEASWDLVERVDRNNFGIVLDTFNIAARIYADPTAETGRISDAERAVKQSMARLANINRDKVFYVQVVDGERLKDRLIENHAFYDESQPARMSWSRNCRLFYGEMGGYLPVRKIADIFFNTLGFEGWVSLELFNRRMSDDSKHVPDELASRGLISWHRLVREMGLEVEPRDLPRDLTRDMSRDLARDIMPHIMSRVNKPRVMSAGTII